jgi:hypothetical protein
MSRIRIMIASTICVVFAGLLSAAQDPTSLSPFNVSTDKDVGYGNRPSGGRVDTPLAIRPSANAATAALATSTDLPSLRISVSRVSESRSSQGSGSTNLELSVVGEGLSQDAVVRQVTVTKAVDNNDRPLLGGPGGAGGRGGAMSPMAMINRMSNPGGMAQAMQARATLGLAPRGADSIKYVEGTIEIYLPAESNGSMIRIGNIKSHLGRVEDPTLAKHGIVFHFLGDKASEDEARALMSGSGGSSSARIDSVTGYGYYFRDPSGKLAGVQLQDGKGAPFRGGGGGGGGGPNGTLMTYSLPSPIMDDTQLVLYVAVPEAIKTVPFRVEDIALP